MAYEAKLTGKGADASHGKFPKYYPRLVVILGFAIDIAVLVIYSKVLVGDKVIHQKHRALPFVHLGIIAFRILIYSFLLLSQTPLLYRSSYSTPPGTADERTGLLSSAAPNGYSAIPTSASTSASPLRSTKPPSNRPDDPKSLSILTIFSRVKTLFPYLWPSKSFSLQVIAVVCFTLMIAKRYFNVAAPIFFGRIISDLSNGRAPYGNLAIYVTLSFLQDSNSMLVSLPCVSLRCPKLTVGRVITVPLPVAAHQSVLGVGDVDDGIRHSSQVSLSISLVGRFESTDEGVTA